MTESHGGDSRHPDSAETPPALFGPRKAGTGGAAVPPPSRRWPTRVLLPVILLLAVGALFAYTLGDALRPAVAVEVVPAVVRDVEGADRGGEVIAQAPGWVEPAPFPRRVAARRDGLVEQVRVLEGDRVEEGDVVARLVSDDARLALARAEAAVAVAEAEVQSSQRALGLGNVSTDRDDSLAGAASATSVEGSALAELEAELERLPAEVAGYEAKVGELRAELTARRSAAERDLVGPVQVEMLEARLKAAEADLQVARRQEAVLEARFARRRAELKSELAVARAKLDAARAARAEAVLALERSEVVSPVAGVVMARAVEPGSSVYADHHEGATIVRLYDPEQLQVRVDVPQAEAARIGAGQAARVTVDVLSDREFEGRVTRVMHEADISRNTLQFKVAIAEPSPQLKPEMTARVQFLAAGSESESDEGARGSRRVFAPVNVAGDEAGGTREVWLADHEDRAVRRQVALGELRHGAWIEIRSGLNPGDRLIVDPPAGLRQGQRLSVQQTTSNQGPRTGSNQ